METDPCAPPPYGVPLPADFETNEEEQKNWVNDVQIEQLRIADIVKNTGKTGYYKVLDDKLIYEISGMIKDGFRYNEMKNVLDAEATSVPVYYGRSKLTPNEVSLREIIEKFYNETPKSAEITADVERRKAEATKAQANYQAIAAKEAKESAEKKESDDRDFLIKTVIPSIKKNLEERKGRPFNTLSALVSRINYSDDQNRLLKEILEYDPSKKTSSDIGTDIYNFFERGLALFPRSSPYVRLYRFFINKDSNGDKILKQLTRFKEIVIYSYSHYDDLPSYEPVYTLNLPSPPASGGYRRTRTLKPQRKTRRTRRHR